MKLIIDISEEDRKDIGNIHFVREDLKFKIGKAIMNGTPLEDIIAEIEASKWTDRDIRFERNALASGLERAIEIINDSIGRAENEVSE